MELGEDEVRYLLNFLSFPSMKNMSETCWRMHHIVITDKQYQKKALLLVDFSTKVDHEFIRKHPLDIKVKLPFLIMLNEKEVTDFLVQFEKRIVVLMLSNYTKQPAGQIDNEEYFEKTSSNNLGVTSLTNLKKVVLTRFDYTAFGTTELRTL